MISKPMLTVIMFYRLRFDKKSASMFFSGFSARKNEKYDKNPLFIFKKRQNTTIL